MRELLLGITVGFGARFAHGPLLTDGPIIAIVVPLISTLPPATESALSVAGGLFVLYLGVETIRGARSTELSRDAGN